jgi:hypothetical protein
MTDHRKSTSTGALERRKRNRRAFPRWALDFPVNVRWHDHAISCRGYEIGEGGLSILSQAALPTEVELDVEYWLDPQSPRVMVKGIIRHVEGVRYGIEFLNLGMKERLALVEYCEKLRTL